MGQSTEMSTLISILFRRFLNPLKYLMDISNILVYIGLERMLTGEERRWHGLHDSSSVLVDFG